MRNLVYWNFFQTLVSQNMAKYFSSTALKLHTSSDVARPSSIINMFIANNKIIVVANTAKALPKLAVLKFIAAVPKNSISVSGDFPMLFRV